MTTIQIPRTPKGVTDQLGEIGELLTATEWTRAALLAAVVRLDPGGGGRNARKPAATGGFLSATAFSELGITGLRSKGTVTLYVQRWLDANDGKYPELGKKVKLPDTDWPPRDDWGSGYDSTAGAEKTIEKIIEKHGPQVIAAAVRRPEVAAAVHEDPEASLSYIREMGKNNPPTDRGRPGGGAVGGLEKMIIQILSQTFAKDGEELKKEVAKHIQEMTPWRPKEQEQVLRDARRGVEFGSDVIAMLSPISDEELNDLLSGS